MNHRSSHWIKILALFQLIIVIICTEAFVSPTSQFVLHRQIYQKGSPIQKISSRTCHLHAYVPHYTDAYNDNLAPEAPIIRGNSSLFRTLQRKAARLNVKQSFKLGGLFGLWYILSIWYNIYSKRTLNIAPELAWTAAWFQMTLGLLYVVPCWLSGFRIKPKLTKSNVQKLLPVAALHSLVHVGGVVSMGAGAVSFTYIVKASEPAVSALLAALVLKSYLPLHVYLTLIPVMVGVALSSVSELSFNWIAFNYAMLSNVASASRGILGKKRMNQALGENMDARNMYSVVTILSSLLLLPAVTFLEGPKIMSSFKSLSIANQGKGYALQTVLAALFYYTYNEVSFLCLENISPVSHALANTLKRVFIILTSMMVFGNRMTPWGILGSIMAIGGVLLYTLAKTSASAEDKQ